MAMADRDAPLERELLRVVAELVRETHRREAPRRALALDSRLDRDLGLDSMARAELLLRLERAFAVDLPESALAAATPRALLQAVRKARGTVTRAEALARIPPPEPPAGEPAAAGTLQAALDWHLERYSGRVHLYLYEHDGMPRAVGYGELDHGARRMAAGLRELGVVAGDRVALMLPTGLDYFHAFVGILRCGAVPVPMYPPAPRGRVEDHLRRHARILANAGAALLVTVPEARGVARLLRAEMPRLARVLTPAELASAAGDAVGADAGADDLALLQYTSGSTGDPKGVMLTHAQLLANIRAMGERIGVRPGDVFASWLPLYHDMGLIAAWLGSLYYGVPLAVMSPLAFLRRPLRWLELIHRHRATLSGGPNFGYALCLRALTPERLEALADLDLSDWRLAFNGAEPVSAATLEAFAERLAGCGFRREALLPVYGLAEAAVGLCCPVPGRGPVLERIDRERLAAAGRAVPAAPGAMARGCVSCGPPLPGYEVRVVDATGRELPERHEGEVEFRGPSATAGYYRNPSATAGLFRGEWLRTGDRGYAAAGELYVTGRSKDVIIRGGRNVHPHELEEAVEALPGIRNGCVAVFGDTDPATGSEALVVVAETRVADAGDRARLEAEIRRLTAELVDLPAEHVRLVAPHSVLKTSSGKIRRAATRELYRSGRLGAPRSTIRVQVARFAVRTCLARLARGLRTLGAYLYAAGAWGVFGAAATLAWLGAVLLPRRSWRWRLVRGMARAAARIGGVRLQVRGLANLPRSAACVLVANHASYLDALVLTAALPRGFRHVAKRELAGRAPVRILLQRLGTLFVERLDPRQAAWDVERIQVALDPGDALAVFPEGTFRREPGLGTFHMGAFMVAVRRGIPVLPVAIEGARLLLRAGEWFPRPGRVRVTVGEPLQPQGDGWEEAVRLRDAARAFIAGHCGEPDRLAADGVLGGGPQG